MKFLHSFLCFLLLISGLFVSSSVNPIESVLFLILAFFNAALILFLLNAEFLGLTFILVYVGAIAVGRVNAYKVLFAFFCRNKNSILEVLKILII